MLQSEKNSIPYPFMLFDSLNEGVYIVDTAWHFIYVNKRAAEIQDKPPEELLGKNIWELYPEAVEMVSYSQAHHAVEKNIPVSYEIYYPLLETWFESRLYPCAEGLIILLQDISERKRQEETLQQSQARARRLIDANIIGVVISDMDHIFEANDAFLEIVGYTREDLAAKRINWIAMTPPELLPLDMNAIQELKEQGTFTPFEKAYYRKDGRLVPILIGGAVLEKDPLQWVCFILDISEQKTLEQALRESEERMRIALKGASITVYQQDRELRYTWIYNMQAHTVEDIIGKTDADLIEAEEAVYVTAIKRRVLETGQSYQEVVKATGIAGLRYFDLSIEPLHNGNGEVIGVTGTSRDVTEQVELEKRKDDFISIASHELRTPITVLRGYTQLLARQLDQQGIQEPVSMLKTMDAQISRLVRLVDELLDASKIQAGRLDYEEEPVDLDALVHETVEMLQASSPTHTLYVSGATLTVIPGDKDLLGQVFTNLITNAVKYSPQANSVDITLSSTKEATLVSIRDYGVGIASAHQKHIFDRFYRVYDSNNKSFKGLGLGLYIAHDIVKRHGGNLTVESAEGKGSSFTISLPLEK
ncbi:MAG TPA: ATP-binding protein [Ktedonobacteraceae bacterium]|nr:ATP-binding protein [Ktedonobacteraceae bacterium]